MIIHGCNTNGFFDLIEIFVSRDREIHLSNFFNIVARFLGTLIIEIIEFNSIELLNLNLQRNLTCKINDSFVNVLHIDIIRYK